MRHLIKADQQLLPLCQTPLMQAAQRKAKDGEGGELCPQTSKRSAPSWSGQRLKRSPGTTKSGQMS